MKRAFGIIKERAFGIIKALGMFIIGAMIFQGIFFGFLYSITFNNMWFK